MFRPSVSINVCLNIIFGSLLFFRCWLILRSLSVIFYFQLWQIVLVLKVRVVETHMAEASLDHDGAGIENTQAGSIGTTHPGQ